LSVTMENALVYPLTNKKNLVIGGLYVLFAYIVMMAFQFAFIFGQTTGGEVPAMFIVKFLVYLVVTMLVFLPITGYIVKIIKDLLNGGQTLPAFSGFKELFTNGIKVVLVMIPYMVVFLILYFVGLMAMFYNIILVIIGIPLILLALLVIFSSYVGIIHFANTGSVKSGANVIFVLALIKNNLWAFVIAFLKALVVQIIYSFSMILIVTIPFAVLASYAAFMYILTSFYQEATSKA
jgi:hypothetical protein